VKCLIVLSSKSSGSSVLQRVLATRPQVRFVDATRHRQYETLFWVKAASVLGRPQVKMLRSEVPIPRDKARADLVTLLAQNLGPSFRPMASDRDLIFEGWHQLCRRYAPVFLEKSPHHLHQWSALELILECMQQLPDVEFFLIGLVRNPMDTAYSLWRRWRIIPELSQLEWHTAYTNLQKLVALVPDRLAVLRYEDLIADPSILRPVDRFLGSTGGETKLLHGDSIARWKQDRSYGCRLSEPVLSLGEQYGYARADMTGESRVLWPAYRQAAHWFYRGMHGMGPAKPVLKAIRDGVSSRFGARTRG